MTRWFNDPMGERETVEGEANGVRNLFSSGRVTVFLTEKRFLTPFSDPSTPLRRGILRTFSEGRRWPRDEVG
jgi:hypothetical protein